MENEYRVEAFVPSVKGCGATDQGWDGERCKQFQKFLNSHTADGWKFHSSDYRNVTMQGCSGSSGPRLVCVFERNTT